MLRRILLGKPKKKSDKSAAREWAEMIVFLAFFAVFVRMFMFQIPSGSMEDTLLVGDFIFVNRFVYGFQIPLTDAELPAVRDPERGDVIVFRYPPDPGKNYIKRVIGAPGDTLKINGRQVMLNKEYIEEPYVKHIRPQMLPADYIDPRISPPGMGNQHFYGPVVVPEDHYFVMGDNRDNSEDSRVWGFVPEENIKGKALFIWWSSKPAKAGGIEWRRLGKVVH